MDSAMITFQSTPPSWVKWRGTRQRVTFLNGFKKTDDGHTSFYFGGEEIAVDYGIWRLIMELNLRGFSTVYCCSGLPEDHRPWKKNKITDGYIAFAKEYIELNGLLPDGLYSEPSHTWWAIRTRREIPGYARRAAWLSFRRALSDSTLYEKALTHPLQFHQRG